MKICVCSSLSFIEEVNNVARKLVEMGHEVLLPNGIINRLVEKENFDPVRAKIDTQSCQKHVDKIREADAVLVCNYDKNGISNYVGANTFAELFTACYFGKPIFALNPLPDQPYIYDEIHSFGIIVVDGDLNRIKLK